MISPNEIRIHRYLFDIVTSEISVVGRWPWCFTLQEL